jgi:hypothetical protein
MFAPYVSSNQFLSFPIAIGRECHEKSFNVGLTINRKYPLPTWTSRAMPNTLSLGGRFE